VQVLQQKAVVNVARENLEYYDGVIDIQSQPIQGGRYCAGGSSTGWNCNVSSFESDLQTALVNLRTAKIQLIALLNDRAPVEQLDVAGQFDFTELATPQAELREIALGTRPGP